VKRLPGYLGIGVGAVNRLTYDRKISHELTSRERNLSR
jgi:hypothetical protein